LSALTAEVSRLEKGLARITMSSSEWMETPMRIHSKDTDAGGAPELAPEFVRWVGQVCSCSRKRVCATGCRASLDGGRHLSDCDPGCPHQSFRASQNHADRHRLKRALRQLRSIAPAEFDIVNLIVTRGLSPDQARARINESRAARAQASYSPFEFAILTIAGTAKLLASF
jgi:hypothetical protein